MTDFYREVVISLEWLFCVMAFFHLHLANMCFCLREIVSTNKMINISKNLGRAYGKAGIRNRNWNPNLRNKTSRRFCLKSVTNNYCSIKTFHPHIIFIYCYYIFYCRIFCVRRKIFLREFHIRVSVATWDHDWHEYSSSLCRLFLTMDETRSPFKKWVT